MENDAEQRRKTFRPCHISTLFIGESRPHGNSFFYNGNSNLFREMKNVFGGKETFISDFKSKGHYLDDLVLEPVNQLSEPEKKLSHQRSIPSLVSRLRGYSPEAIVIIGRGINKPVRDAANLASFTGPIYCVPFPGRPQHKEIFKMEMLAIIHMLPVTNQVKERQQ